MTYVSYKAAERRRESMFVFGCAGAMLVPILFGVAAAGLFIAGFQWGSTSSPVSHSLSPSISRRVPVLISTVTAMPGASHRLRL
jgi:hypothetical protein